MEQKKYYLTIAGTKAEVSEDIYRAYVRPVRNAQRSEERRSRCIGAGGNRCNGDCSACRYFRSGKPYSLEQTLEEGVDVKDPGPLVEDIVEQKILYEALHSAIDELPPKEKKAALMYADDETVTAIGAALGMTQQGASKLLQRVWKKLADKLKDYR